MQASKYLELKVPATAMPEADFERITEALQATGTSLETDADSSEETRIAWFECGESDTDERVLRARIGAAVQLAGTSESAISLSVLSDDWETAWQKEWKAMPIGKQLCVRPSFCEPLEDSRVDIVLDPGMAFGTGQHATTQLCLEAIERYCENHLPQSLLDMGAGSGLLAIAAGKLGAQGIVAIDNDPISVEASRVNAELNGVTLVSQLNDTPPNDLFELVVANILAGPLIEMAKGLAGCTRDRLILSGLLETQIESVAKAYEDIGMKRLRADVKGEWASLEFSKQ